MAMHNRPDEWKIEQGIHGASLPILDQSGGESRYVKPFEYEPFKDEAAIKAVGNPDELFAEEREGWSGYVEWENYPEKKEKANKILTSQNVCMTLLWLYVYATDVLASFHHHQSFRWVPFQVISGWRMNERKCTHSYLETNPVLEGTRWKQWHTAIGGALTNIPDISWEIVKKEKHEEMLHLLQFPYNGECMSAQTPLNASVLKFSKLQNV
jgi:sulfite oxidase